MTGNKGNKNNKQKVSEDSMADPKTSESPAVCMLRRAREMLRVTCARDQEIRLAKVWKHLLKQSEPKDQHIFLQSLCVDFGLSLTFVHILITYSPLAKHKILFHMMNSITGIKGTPSQSYVVECFKV